MKASRFAVIIVSAACCVGCGDKSPTGPSDTPSSSSSARLTTANSLTEFVNLLATRYNFNASNLLEYDHSPADFPAALSYLKTADPIAGTWDNIPEVQFPTPNGRSTLGPAGANRKIAYTSYDLVNGLVLEGQFQAFWGVKDLSNQNNLAQVPVAIVTEGIVSLAGVPKYRGMQVMVGTLINTRFRSAGGVSVTPPTIAITGYYVAMNIETLDKNDPRVPCVFNCTVQYPAIWLR